MQQHKNIFITSSGTDIGKTFVSCLIAGFVRFKLGGEILPLKPVISGFDENNISASDSYKLLKSAAGNEPSLADIANISPWRFTPPLSPNMAADMAGITLNLDEITDFCTAQSAIAKSKNQTLLIEGVGGVMVPINNHHTTLDLMARLDYPVILVVGSYLGSISHSLTATQALQNNSIKIDAIIVNESPSGDVSLTSTISTLKNHIKNDIPLLAINYMEKLDENITLSDEQILAILDESENFTAWLGEYLV